MTIITFPPIPNAYFDVKKWFTSTFRKNTITGQTIGYKFNYEDHLNLFVHANFIIGETDVKVVNTFGEFISVIPISVYKKFVSRGEWDDTSFTKNERKLAWKIECLSNMLIDKRESIQNAQNAQSTQNNDIESNIHSDFDFGLYDYTESDDDEQCVLEKHPKITNNAVEPHLNIQA